ncbi:hypothetical protein Rhal01_02322 [Rubritalea halochordaticola]|uniref:Lipoprotein n=1 Tax=Rubritalea halochordaticola TaxID=714537 RepID=A0ABP9V0J6_9BACT
MIKKLLHAVSGAFCLFAFANCTSSTPAARIQQNPVIYDNLSSKDQELVKQGRIAKGMSKKAVFLAWGHPSNNMAGSRDGKDFERWLYNSYRPVYTNRFYGNYGYRWGRYGHPYSGFGFGPEVNYVPERTAYVEFRKERVTSWARRR